MSSIELIITMVVAVILSKSVSFETCKARQNDPMCKANSTVDALELSVNCLSTLSASIVWEEKREFQLMQLEYICFNTSSQNYNDAVIKGPSGSKQGFYNVSGFEINEQVSCTFFGCVYISQEDCWQTNQDNITCSYKGLLSSSKFISASSVLSSHIIPTLNTLSSTKVDVISSRTLHSIAVSTSSVPGTVPSNSPDPQSAVNDRIYLMILFISIFAVGLISMISIILLLMYCNWRKSLKISVDRDHFYHHKYEQRSDFKNSISSYSFGGSSMNGSTVTKLDSLVFTNGGQTSSKSAQDQPLSGQNSKTISNHQTKLETSVEETSESDAKFESDNVMFPLSPSSSANSSYCQMSEIADSETKMNSSTSGSNTSLESALKPFSVHTVGVISFTSSFRFNDRNNNFHSTTDQSPETLSIRSNSCVNLSCGSTLGPKNHLEHREHTCEVDFCDVDVNTEVDVIKSQNTKISSNHFLKPD